MTDAANTLNDIRDIFSILHDGTTSTWTGEIKNQFMQFETFLQSISSTAPESSVYLQSVWYDAKRDWDKAHALVDSLHDETACWVHAYLHRKEGDIGNADYWYHRAGKTRPSGSLQEEWEVIVKALL